MVQAQGGYVGTTRDGYDVYDRTDSHLHLAPASSCGLSVLHISP